MTNEELYTKALSIPLKEWGRILDETPFKHVHIDFGKGEIYLGQKSGFMHTKRYGVIDKGGWFCFINGVSMRGVMEAIKAYNPTPELVWEEFREDEFRTPQLSFFVEPAEDSIGWIWVLYRDNKCVVHGQEDTQKSAIEAAKANASEIAKSILA